MSQQRHKIIPAVFVLFQKGTKFFFIKRANTGWMDGMWDVPSGHLESGEYLADAAIREALEESGVTVRKENVKLVHCQSELHGDWDRTGFFFKVEEWVGEPTNAETDRSSECAWIDPEERTESEFAPTMIAALQQIKLGKNYSEFDWNKAQ